MQNIWCRHSTDFKTLQRLLETVAHTQAARMATTRGDAIRATIIKEVIIGNRVFFEDFSSLSATYLKSCRASQMG
jgi:hypothetical protein